MVSGATIMGGVPYSPRPRQGRPTRYSSYNCIVRDELPDIYLALPLDLAEGVPHQQRLAHWNPPSLTSAKMMDGTTMAEGVATSPEPHWQRLAE